MLEKLERFALEARFRGKGPLCVALVVTDHARRSGLPLLAENLITEGEGQVLGLGRSKVQAILAKHGITKTLALEGGRTSRGSIGNMRTYVGFLNQMNMVQEIDIDAVEQFWIEKVKLHFSAKPFTLRLDPSLGIRSVVRAVMEQAKTRQDNADGSMIVGTVMQHLVGAKIDVAMAGRGLFVAHHGSNQNDVAGRGGDFDLGDVSIHVTNSPGELVIAKCATNLSQGYKAIIVTSSRGVAVAEVLSENAGIGSRVDIIEFEQFLAMNIYEMGMFDGPLRRQAILNIVTRYNEIVSAYENDDSMIIDMR